MEREGKQEREREKEKVRFRKIAQFWELGSEHGAQQSFEKIPSDTIGKLAGEDHEFPHPFCVPTIAPPPPHHPPPPTTPPTPPPSFSSGIGGVERRARYPRRVDLKSDGLKGVFPLSTVDELSDKSIYVLANEGWKWRFLIGPFSDHSPFVNKGFWAKAGFTVPQFLSKDLCSDSAERKDLETLLSRTWGLNFNHLFRISFNRRMCSFIRKKIAGTRQFEIDRSIHQFD